MRVAWGVRASGRRPPTVRPHGRHAARWDGMDRGRNGPRGRDRHRGGARRSRPAAGSWRSRPTRPIWCPARRSRPRWICATDSRDARSFSAGARMASRATDRAIRFRFRSGAMDTSSRSAVVPTTSSGTMRTTPAMSLCATGGSVLRRSSAGRCRGRRATARATTRTCPRTAGSWRSIHPRGT